MFRLSLLAGALLGGAPWALAESPQADPLPPAVLGRPLDQIQPARQPSAAAKPAQPRHAAKQALDDRADPRVGGDDVGKGTHYARKRLAPGAYIGAKYRVAVHKYFEAHPATGAAANWQIGEPVPRGAAAKPVPKGLLASLPPVPPGHRYLQLGGDVLLVAAQSSMVVDGVSRRPR